MVHLIDETRCPSCNQALNATHCPNEPERRPAPGDWSVCAGCLTVLELTEQGGWREVSAEEIDALSMPQQIELLHMRVVLALANLLHPPPSKE